MELNKLKYKRHIRPFDTSKKPRKVTRAWVRFVKLLGKIASRGKIGKLEKINMEGLEPPFLILSNHQSFSDMEITAQLTYPHKFHTITSFEGYCGYFGVRAWMMERAGCIPKRRFTTDPHLLSSCETVLKEYGDVLTIYPEAQYTNIGVTAVSQISSGYAQLIKKLGVPVVAIVHRGNYLRTPFWDWRRARGVKTHSTMKKILSVEEIESLSCEEILKIVRNELYQDDYKWQKENSIIIDAPFRAEGLNKVLYQCPHCLTEHSMLSQGTKLWCASCGKEWEMTELGQLRALNGETEFSHIPDWYDWERQNVIKEVEAGKYLFEDEAIAYALPNNKSFIKLGKAHVKHSLENGLTIEGEYNKEKYKFSRPSRGLYGIHIEYNYDFKLHEACIQLSVADNTIVCYPKKKDVVTKIYFAVHAIHSKLMREREENKKNREKKAD